MELEKAVQDIHYYQYWLVKGGINPDYAKSQIVSIMSQFDDETRKEIRKKVETMFVK